MAGRSVLITGAAGRIGGGIATSLKRQGAKVVAVDRIAEPSGSNPWDAYFQVDLAAAAIKGSEAEASLRRAAQNIDIFIHCAAWPGPAATPPCAIDPTQLPEPVIGLEEVAPFQLLQDNIASTTAICDAAILNKASRVVFSSSAFAMGWSHMCSGDQSFKPRYLPMDEEHGPTPFESYGLSKAVGEDILSCAARTSRTTSFVSLRFTNIVKREKWDTLPWPAPTASKPIAFLLWAYTHEDDVIDAHVAAALKEDAASPGTHEAYLISAPDTRFKEPTLDLLATTLNLDHEVIQKQFGGSAMKGNASILSAAKARRRLGFLPRAWSSDGDGVASGERLPKRVRSSSEWLRGSNAARTARAHPETRFFPLEGFRLESGEVLPHGACLAYRIHGTVGAKVILHPTSFDAVHTELEYQIGPDDSFALNTSKYCIVVVNLMGNGVSFSPSTDPELLHRNEFPRLITIADNVRAQRLMLKEALGIEKLEAVYGYSMGALQAMRWAADFPDDVRGVVAVCGAARCGPINTIFLDSLEAALTTDAGWAGHYFKERPVRGLEAFARIYAGWGVGSSWYSKERFKEFGYTSATDFATRSYVPGFENCDPDDLLTQIRTWRAATFDDAKFNEIKCKCLLMPCDSDRYFTLEESEREAKALGSKALLRPIRSDFGHRGGDPHRDGMDAERTFIRTQVHELLSSLQ